MDFSIVEMQTCNSVVGEYRLHLKNTLIFFSFSRRTTAMFVSMLVRSLRTRRPKKKAEKAGIGNNTSQSDLDEISVHKIFFENKKQRIFADKTLRPCHFAVVLPAPHRG